MVDDDELARILGSGRLIEIGKKDAPLITQDIILEKTTEIKFIKPEQIDTYNDEVGIDPNVRSDPLVFLTFITLFTTLERRPDISPIHTNNLAQIKSALEKTEFEELKAVWNNFNLKEIPLMVMVLQGINILLENVDEQDYAKLKDSLKKKLEKPDFSFTGSFKIWTFKEIPPVVYNGCIMILNNAKSWKELSQDELKLINSYLEMAQKYNFNELKKIVNQEYLRQKEKFMSSGIMKIEENMIETVFSVALLFKILGM